MDRKSLLRVRRRGVEVGAILMGSLRDGMGGCFEETRDMHMCGRGEMKHHGPQPLGLLASLPCCLLFRQNVMVVIARVHSLPLCIDNRR